MDERKRKRKRPGNLKDNEDDEPFQGSKMQSPHKLSSTNGGFGGTSEYLRSVLMHPMGFALVIYLNDIPRHSDHPAYIWTALDDFAGAGKRDNKRLRENVFAATALDWGDGETDFTQKLCFNINLCKIGKLPLTTAREKKVAANQDEKGKLDLIFHENKKEEDGGKSSVVAIFEFGLGNEMWWTKQDQILNYVSILSKDEDENYEIDQPILLSVITINKTSQIDNKNIKEWAKKKLRDQQKKDMFESNLKRITELPTSTNTKDIAFEARFGVFLCVPKGKGKFRIALLWRHTTKNLQDASTQFGNILYAVQLCSFLGKSHSLGKDTTIPYTYLGPNCCRIGNSVYRAYDDRLRHTDRRPQLYLSNDVTINDAKGPIAKTVLEIRDKHYLQEPIESDTTTASPSSPDNEDIRGVDRLWRYRGKLLVISTKYHNGVHYAKSLLHFKPIINHLEQLHRQALVHGDIRAYNMVLSYGTQRSETDQAAIGATSSNESENNSNGWLIDFDFGGIHNDVVYPKGYRHSLEDGERPGRAGNKITILDDWKSLINLIRLSYSLVKKEGTELTTDQISAMFYAEKALDSYCNTKDDESLLSDYESPARLLLEYIDHTSVVYDLAPSSKFELDLINCGLWSDENTLKASGAATGSPPKNKSDFK